jgi:hypothetical protein
MSDRQTPVDMFNMINSINATLQENSIQDEEICVICQDVLDNGEEMYRLPECEHGYHTNCIVTWFRSGNNRCPCCGNKGINERMNNAHGNWRPSSCWSTKTKPQKFIKLRAFLGKPECPKELVTLYDMYDKTDELINSYQSERKKLLESDGPYKEINKLTKNLRTKYWRFVSKRRRIISDIMEYPIVPLIIPIPKKV